MEPKDHQVDELNAQAVGVIAAFGALLDQLSVTEGLRATPVHAAVVTLLGTYDDALRNAQARVDKAEADLEAHLAERFAARAVADAQPSTPPTREELFTTG